MKKVLKNMFSLEGIDGSGKTTQAPLLKKSLTKFGFSVHILKSPSESILGEFIRKNVRTFTPHLRNSLFILDMQLELIKQENEYSASDIFIWDRYIDSFYASNPEMTIKEANKLVIKMPIPIKTFWFNIDPSVVLKNRSQVTNEHSDPKWLLMKQERYEELFYKNSDRIININAQQPINLITDIITRNIIKIMQT